MKAMFKISVAALALTGAATPALAQRDPAYAAARESGQVGEQVDGYLGVVGAGSPEVRALAAHINIQRKDAYTKGAADSATIEQFAFVSGCNLILKTAPGEKYQAPDGSWKTRTAAAPQRDSRCTG